MPRRALILLAPLLLVLAVLPFARARAVTDPPGCPVIISHAGAKALAPENTVPGILAARDFHGVDYVEIDIRYNKSNFAFAIHNDDLAITTTGTGSIRDLWLGQVQALSAADYGPWPASVYGGFNPDGTPKVRVPYTHEWMTAVKAKDLTVVIDAKVTPTEVQADSVIGDYASRPYLALRPKIRWMANSTAGLTAMRGWYPDLEYWLIGDPASQAIWTGEYLVQLGATTVSYVIGKITPALVDYYHAFGIKVNTWTTNSASTDTPGFWAQARAADVDYLTTDHADQALLAQAATCSPVSPSPSVSPTTSTTPSPTPTIVDPEPSPSESIDVPIG